MARKLYYFDTFGICEGVRYLLHYVGWEFEDVRIPMVDYAKYKESIDPPFGKLPVYREATFTLHQSASIARYIARQNNLVPTDPLEDAQVEAVVLTLFDMLTFMKSFGIQKDPPDDVKLKIAESFEFHFSRFEKQLEESGGYFGKKLSWGDIFFVGFTDTFVKHKGSAEMFEAYPNVKSLRMRIHQLPAIKSYIDSRKP